MRRARAAGACAEPAGPRQRRGQRAVAADGAAPRREHRARHPLPGARVHRRSRDLRVSRQPRRAADAGHRRRAARLRVLRAARPRDQCFRAAGRVRRRAHRADQRGGHRVRAGLGAGARDFARHPAAHRAHDRPAAADADPGDGGDRRRDPVRALAARPRLGRRRRGAGRGRPGAAQLFPRLRARGRSRRPAGAQRRRLRRARDGGVFREDAALGPRQRRRLDSRVPAYPPGHHRAHRRRAEQGGEHAVPAASGQPGVPTGARQGARALSVFEPGALRVCRRAAGHRAQRGGARAARRAAAAASARLQALRAAVEDLRRARQAAAAAPGAGRVLRPAGQLAGGDRAAAARALRRRRRFLPAVGGRRAPQGPARAVLARDARREALDRVGCATKYRHSGGELIFASLRRSRALARAKRAFSLGRLDEAEASLTSALRTNGNDAVAHNLLGMVLRERGRAADAQAHFRQAIGLKPEFTDAYINLGAVLNEQRRAAEAEDAFRRALALEPKHAVAWCNLGLILSDQGWQEQAEDCFLAALSAEPDYFYARLTFVMNKLLEVYGSADEIARARAAYELALRELPRWLENIDRSRLEIHGYYTGHQEDRATVAARRACKQFVEGLPFDALAKTIRSDSLHVLIFPEIGMDPVTTKLATLRLAPVQCNSWGHPITSGMPTMDYYLSSDLMEPADGQEHYTEELVRQ